MIPGNAFFSQDLNNSVTSLSDVYYLKYKWAEFSVGSCGIVQVVASLSFL